MISLRFYWYPSTFKASFTHPTESLFVPASVVSCGTVLTNITEFAVGNGRSGYWLERTMIVLFWVYCGMALSFTCGIYLIMWSTQTYTISRMTPGMLNHNLRVCGASLTSFHSMDLPGIPVAYHWATCWKAVRKSGERVSTTNHRRRILSPRHRLHDVSHGLQRLPLSPYDAKATKRIPSSWHVHLRRSFWLHHCGCHQHGPEPPSMYTRELHGCRRDGWNNISRYGQLAGHMAVGSCHFLLHRLLRCALVLCEAWTSPICFDLVLLHLSKYRSDRKSTVCHSHTKYPD
jgi:hypothetical protein